jgi:hypothetical protein
MFIGFFASFLLWSHTSMADVYLVKQVKVDIVSESSLEARNKAFQQAQETAFAEMAKRFLSGEKLASFKPPAFDAIARMVRDVELVNEKSSARRYVGIFNIRFKEGATRRYFGNAPITNVADEDSSKSKLLIIPLFKQNEIVSLWNESQNPYLKYLRKQKIDSEFTVARGDTLDAMDIKADIIDRYNKGLIKRIRARYDAPEVVITLARYDPKADPQLAIDLYRTDGRKLILAKTLEYNVLREKTLGALFQRVIPDVISNLQGNWKEIPKPMVETILSDVIQTQDTEPRISKEESGGEIITPQTGTANIIVQFQSVSEWINIRRSLSNTPSIQSVKLDNLSTFEAHISVNYIDLQSMIRNLQMQNFIVRPLSADSYLISLRNQP